MPKKSLRILFVSWFLLLASCAGIPDKPVCVDVRPSQGFCVWTVSAKEQIVDDTHPFIDENGKALTWVDMQIGVIKMPLETWKAIKKYLINSCKKNSSCEGKIDSWDRSMTRLERQATE